MMRGSPYGTKPVLCKLAPGMNPDHPVRPQGLPLKNGNEYSGIKREIIFRKALNAAPLNNCFAPENHCFPSENGCFMPENDCFRPENDCFRPDNRCFAPENHCFAPENGCFLSGNDCFLTDNHCFPTYQVPFRSASASSRSMLRHPTSPARASQPARTRHCSRTEPHSRKPREQAQKNLRLTASSKRLAA